MRVQLVIAFAILGSVVVLGCGQTNETPTYPVTGKVTYAGKPIESGAVVFDPVNGGGPSGMGGIVNGDLTAQAPEGEMILRFSAVRTSSQKDQYGELITESYIPDKYNSKSEIQKTISPDAKNHFDIELK